MNGRKKKGVLPLTEIMIGISILASVLTVAHFLGYANPIGEFVAEIVVPDNIVGDSSEHMARVELPNCNTVETCTEVMRNLGATESMIQDMNIQCSGSVCLGTIELTRQ